MALCAVVVVAAGAVLVPFAPAPAPAAAPKPLFEVVGSLDRFGADARAALGSKLVPTWEQATVTQRNRVGTIIVVPQTRRLLQLYDLEAPPSAGIVVRDLDSLQIVGTVRLNEQFERATMSATQAGDWSHAVDDTGTRVFLLRADHQFVFEVDIRTLTYKSWPLPGNATPTGAPLVPVGGLTYDPYEDDLLVLSGGPGAFSVGNFNTFLYRLDLSGKPPASFPIQELADNYRIRSCSGPVTPTDSGAEMSDWEMLVTKDHLYVPCQRAGHTVVVVRMARPSGNRADHREDVAAGPVFGDAVLADQRGGRLFVTTTRREIWAFETSTMAFVGAIATGPENTTLRTSYGLDPFSGRVYFQSPSFGLGVVEGRFFPVPQARTSSPTVTGQERIWTDNATKRIFLLEGDAASATKKPAYKIYRTDAAPVPPSPPDPDRNTADVLEKEGVTEVRYNASGSGYGSRILWARGYATVVPAPTVGVQVPTYDLFNSFASRCGYTDRDVFAGRVARVEYDTGSTAAEAIALDVDSATEQDLNRPSRCGELGLLGDDPGRWAYDPASCSTSEGDEAKEGTGAGKGILSKTGSSSVSCPKPGGTLEARAETELTGWVEVDRSWTQSRIDRTAAGVRSTVESVAQGISIGGTLHIGEIRSKAVSVSNGRPKRGDMSTHEVVIEHVRLGDTALCEARCDPVALEDDLNRLAGARAVFRTGLGPNSGRDQPLLEGSARGAQTAVQKSVPRQASDRALVGDFTVEIPGFEVTVFNDNTRWGRARQLYQFAGVATSATYNIVVPPAPGSFVTPDLPDEVQVAEAGSTPFGALVHGEAVGYGDGTIEGTPGAFLPRHHDDNAVERAMTQLVQHLGRGLGLLFTDPRTALLLLTAWGLLGSPALLARRRRRLSDIRP